jgi:hypothetical protein
MPRGDAANLHRALTIPKLERNGADPQSKSPLILNDRVFLFLSVIQDYITTPLTGVNMSRFVGTATPCKSLTFGMAQS